MCMKRISCICLYICNCGASQRAVRVVHVDGGGQFVAQDWPNLTLLETQFLFLDDKIFLI